MQFTKAEKELITKILRERQKELGSVFPTENKEEFKKRSKEIRAISNIRIKVNHKSH